MFSDRNLINRRNVRADVSKNVSACKKFFLLELEARVVAATMNELEIEDIDAIPSPDKFYVNTENASNQEKIKCLNSLVSKVVNKYILRDDKVQAILDKVQAAKDDSNISKPVGERYMCRLPGCTKSFRYDGKRRRDHEKTHEGMALDDDVETSDKAIDDVFNYQSSFLEVGILLRNFYDAVSEGDGQRIIRCWKFMLPYLIQDGQSSRKYALEAFYLLCQTNSLLSPQAAHQLIWNRFYKLKPGPGGNIPLDLALEHFNRLIKILIKNLGPNGLNKHAIDRYCNALAVNKELLDNFDALCSVTRRSGTHSSHSTNADLHKIVKELIQQKALNCHHGRTYNHFSGMKDSLLADLDVKALFKWMNTHKKKVHLNKCAR